jgi:hypothetical protein
VSVYRPSEAETTVIGGSGREGATESINLEIKDLESVTEQNPLDFLDVSSLNGRDLPTRPSCTGWFSDDSQLQPATFLLRDGRSARSDFGGSSRAVPAKFFEVSGVRSGRESCREKLQACPRVVRSDLTDVSRSCEGRRADAVRRSAVRSRCLHQLWVLGRSAESGFEGGTTFCVEPAYSVGTCFESYGIVHLRRCLLVVLSRHAGAALQGGP